MNDKLIALAKATEGFDEQERQVASLETELEAWCEFFSCDSPHDVFARSSWQDDARRLLAREQMRANRAENKIKELESELTAAEHRHQNEMEDAATGFRILSEQRDAAQAKIKELEARLLTAAGDDLCRLSQEEIKAMGSGEVKIPPKEEFLASCERFHEQVASESGVMTNCLTLAQLIAENQQQAGKLAELEAENDSLAEAIDYGRKKTAELEAENAQLRKPVKEPPALQETMLTPEAAEEMRRILDDKEHPTHSGQEMPDADKPLGFDPDDFPFL